MAIYVSIDESYSVNKLSGINAVVQTCKGYFTRDGKPITAKLVKEGLQTGSFNVYQYDSEELEVALENGSVIGVDWLLKIQTI